MMWIEPSSLDTKKILNGHITKINAYTNKGKKINAVELIEISKYIRCNFGTIYNYLKTRHGNGFIRLYKNNIGQNAANRIFKSHSNHSSSLCFVSVTTLYRLINELFRSYAEFDRSKASDLKCYLYDNFHFGYSFKPTKNNKSVKALKIASSKRLLILTPKQKKFLQNYFINHNEDKSCISTYGVKNRPLEKHILSLKKSKKYLKDLSNKNNKSHKYIKHPHLYGLRMLLFGGDK